jgi:hypothetical protein
VDSNLVTDVNTWIGINLHTASLRCTLSNNTTQRVRRPIFIAAISPQWITDCAVTGNHLLSPGSVTPGEAGIFINITQGLTVTGNQISVGYPHLPDSSEWHNYVYDQGNTSSGLVSSGNTLVTP